MLRKVRSASTAVGLLALILSAALPSDVAAGPRETTLVSVYEDGQFSSNSDSAAISADGRWVAFVVQYGYRDLFLYDRETGETVYVTQGADGDSAKPSISADGRYVAFETGASNLAPDDSNYQTDVLVYDRLNATFARATVASDGAQADNGGADPAISADGRYVAFASQSTNLVPQDPYGASDVYVRDMVAGVTMLASSGGEGRPGGDASYEPAISADGSTVAFTSTAAFDPGDTTGCQGALFAASCPDVYVKDLTSGAIERVSSDGTGGDGASHSPSLSPDGRMVAFASTSSDLVNDDYNGVEDVFVHSRDAGASDRVSLASDGREADGASTRPVFSPDGRFIAFSSTASNLVYGDRNYSADIFVRDRTAATTVRVSVDSYGFEGDGPSDGASLGAGGLAAFSSAGSHLVEQDSNLHVRDVFVREPDDRAPTRTVYLGPDHGSAGIDIAVTALLADAITGGPLADEVVKFEVAENTSCISSVWAPTDANGVASATINLPGGAGAYRMVASFDGYSERQPSSSIVPFSIARRTSTTTYAGDERGIPDVLAYAAARLIDESGSPAAGAIVRFTLSDGEETLREESAASGEDGVAWAYLRLDVPTAEYTVAATFDGDSLRDPSADSRAFSVRRKATRLIYDGPTSAVRGDTVTVSATLREDATEAAVADQTVMFLFKDGAYVLDYVNVPTNAAGVAQAPLNLRWEPGRYTVEAVYAGGGSLDTTRAAAPFEVTLNETTTTYRGPRELLRGARLPVSATLVRTDGGVPVGGAEVRFEVFGDGSLVASTKAWTGPDGVAGTEIATSFPLGDYRVRASFAGSYGEATSFDDEGMVVRLMNTAVTYTGATGAFIGETIEFVGRLVDEDGAALGDREIEFRIVVGGSVLQSVSAHTDAGGHARVAARLDVPAGDHAVEALFAGDDTHAASVASAAFAAHAFATALQYAGPIAAAYEDTVELQASLTRTQDGSAVAGERVVFALTRADVAQASMEGETDAAGLAHASARIDVPAGDYRIEASFAGRQGYAASTTAADFSVALRETTASYAGATIAMYGEPVALRANLYRSGGAAIDGRVVVFEIRTEAQVLQSAAATTTDSGTASTDVAVELPAGIYQIVARFEGDDLFLPSSANTAFEVTARTTALAVTAPASGTRGGRVTVGATLSDALDGSRLTGKTVHFTLGSFTGDASTGADGTASVDAVLDQPPGSYALHASVDGDDTRLATDTTASFEIRWEFAFIDGAGGGTVYLNPSTKEFRLVTLGDASSVKTDVSMASRDLAGRTAVINTFIDGELTLSGTFELDSARFQATAVMRGHTYALRRF